MNLAVAPDNIQSFIDSAAIYMERGEFSTAEEGFVKVLEFDHSCKDALLGLAQICLSCGNPPDKFLDLILQHHSQDPHALISVACIRDDIDLMASAYAILPDDCGIAIAYAKRLIQGGLIADAYKVIKGIDVSNSSIKLCVIPLLVDCSEIAIATAYLTELVTDHPMAQTVVSQAVSLFRDSELDRLSVDNLRSLINMSSTLHENKRIMLNGIGKIEERSGNYSQSWMAYSSANEMVKKDRHSYTDHDEVFNRMRDGFSKSTFQDLPSSSQAPFIFVFGMPRSGTTLTEQILGSHQDITALGELKAASLSTMEFAYNHIHGLNGIPKSPDDMAKYFMDKHTGHFDTRFAVDKMPFNFKYLPMLYLMFPTAKFIYCHRDPLDNCFSCLTTLFAKKHDYSFDQKQMALEYNAHVKLMELWTELLPAGAIHAVKYEDVVGDYERTSRSMIEYIGLDWDSKCLEFWELKRRVKTASLAQVVKPIYGSSVGRAIPYKKHLKVLMENLDVDIYK